MTDDEWEQQRRTQLRNRRLIGWMTLERARTPIGQYAHGTRYGYDKKKCRCDQCREWSRQNKRARWARQHPNAIPRPNARKS